MIRLEVRKIGDALGVVLPNEVLQALRAGEGTVLQLTVAADGGYLLTPFGADLGADVERKERIVKDVAERYRDTLRDLQK